MAVRLVVSITAAPGKGAEFARAFQPRCEQSRQDAGCPGEIELYPGVHHGFAFPERWCYDKPAAEKHWERLIALYRRRLG